MVSVFAQLEGDMISERTTSILRNKKRNGEWVGRVPFGFKLENKQLTEDKNQTKIIERIKQLRRRGKSIRMIAELVSVPKSTVQRLVSTHQNQRKSKYLNKISVQDVP